MITTLFLSHTFASLPNSRLKTPIVPGPHTSWVMRMSAFTHTFSPADTWAFPAALAKIFSVSVISRDAQCNDAPPPPQVERSPIHTRTIHFSVAFEACDATFILLPRVGR